MQKCALTPQREISKLTNVILLMNQYTETLNLFYTPNQCLKKDLF